MSREVMLVAALMVAGCTCGPMPTGPDGGADAGAGDSGAVDAGPDSQQRYTYASCPDDGGSVGGCPRYRVFSCALEAIREKYVSCQSAADCVSVKPPNCIDAMICPPAAVNDAGAFLAEASVETGRYCDGGPCVGFGSCSVSFERGLTDCVGGRCVALQDDGGR